jgi:hypothetical protein
MVDDMIVPYIAGSLGRIERKEIDPGKRLVPKRRRTGRVPAPCHTAGYYPGISFLKGNLLGKSITYIKKMRLTVTDI